jgi:O-antigen/teichoic acid export membrane protein
MTFSARIVAGFGWTAGGRFLGQLVAWGVSIVVVRILTPEDYGLLAMAAVLTGFVALFSELGLGWAVVHAQTVDLLTLRKVFGLVVVVNGALFAFVFAVAPLVALFFGEDRLTDIIRVIAVQFLISAPGVIPDAILQGGRTGWPAILSGLKSVLETGKPLDVKLATSEGMVEAVQKAVAEKPWLRTSF